MVSIYSLSKRMMLPLRGCMVYSRVPASSARWSASTPAALMTNVVLMVPLVVTIFEIFLFSMMKSTT